MINAEDSLSKLDLSRLVLIVVEGVEVPELLKVQITEILT